MIRSETEYQEACARLNESALVWPRTAPGLVKRG